VQRIAKGREVLDGKELQAKEGEWRG